MSADPDGWAGMLGLDHEEALRVGRRTWQWARALVESEAGERELLQGAALYRLAAGHLLLEPWAARDLCAEAAAHLRFASDTYADVLAVCADDRETLRWAIAATPGDRLTAAGHAHVLIALAWASVTGDRAARQAYGAHRGAAEAVAPLPANRLRMPLAATVAVLDAAITDAGPRLASAVHELLSRTDEVFGVAMLDEYHWRRMLSRVWPVEPELIAPLAVAVRAGYRDDQRPVDRGRPAQVALGIASSIAGAAG
jgi:hypothetical protein